ncbi:MAG: YraN family protein [Gammaproteobacteria bacterium]|nr:YraN family protein [Gammaproteobacteria bacterium]MDH5777907.1 YraN family protein [Gammaproteobacteria bacterium]
MVNHSRKTGDEVETLACQYLQQQGLKTLNRNFHCPRGELDVIMEDGDTIVFVEVRYRSNPRFGSSAESVTKSKQDKLITSAMYYLQQNPTHRDRPSRFDVVAVSLQNNKPDIDWIKSAFNA